VESRVKRISRRGRTGGERVLKEEKKEQHRSSSIAGFK